MANIPDLRLRNAKPQEKDYRIQIGGNTYLDILTTGLKVWRMRYLRPPEKKPAILTLGYYPEMGQPEVRQKAYDAKKLVKQGIDPFSYYQAQLEKIEAERQEKARQNSYSFERVAREWHRHRNETLKRWKPAHSDKIIKSLEVDIFPKIGGILVGDLTAPDILEAVQTVIDRGAIETAKKLNRRINSILSYAVTRRLVRYNEAANLREEIPSAVSKNNPYLVADELPDFMRVLCSGEHMGAVVRLAILFVMHTLVRTSEARFAKWSEFDFKSRLWLIPADRMKMKVAHVVPLSSQVIDILQELKLYTGKYDYLFVTRGFNQPMSENAMIYALYRIGYAGRLTIHGLRATGSTLLNEVGFRSDVIEVALAHKDKNQIRVRYNHALYLEERRKMLQWYSDYLSSLKEAKLIAPVKPPKGRMRVKAL